MLLPITSFRIRTMMIERTDLRTELNVACGIALAHYGGIEAGARFMRARGVPLSVACRTLLYPTQRRATDLQ